MNPDSDRPLRASLLAVAAPPISTLSFVVNDDVGTVSALLSRPRGARSLFVFAHGAGAGMNHVFMDTMADRLRARRIATFRYQFPYMEAGRKFPNGKKILLATVRAALITAARSVPRLPIFAGGKSMGGRMTSTAASQQSMSKRVRGLVFLGFPLHPPKKPGTERADHLADVNRPMLFLQGTRDTLAELPLIKPVCKSLGRRAKLHIVDGADHGFHVLKRSGRTDSEVFDELGDTIQTWTEARI